MSRKMTALFTPLEKKQLRRKLFGDTSDDTLIIAARVRPWVWLAVEEIAERDKMAISHVLARAVQSFVISQGFHAPNFVPTETNKPKRGLLARIFGKGSQGKAMTR